jgi:hypothetical protein
MLAGWLRWSSALMRRTLQLLLLLLLLHSCFVQTLQALPCLQSVGCRKATTAGTHPACAARAARRCQQQVPGQRRLLLMGRRAPQVGAGTSRGCLCGQATLLQQW